jgi:hypothetical protein
MSFIILIPAMICILGLLRGPTQRVFLNIVLPVLLLFPQYYFWKVPFLPPITVGDAVLVPLGIGMFFTNISSWRFSRTDLWMALYILSVGYVDYTKDQIVTISIFRFFTAVSVGLFPYMAGKLLIEQPGVRVETVKRFVALLFAGSFLSMYEYFLKDNPFRRMWRPFFHGEVFPWLTQIRWGFGRVAGPFAQSELAGTVLMAGLILALWLMRWNYWEPNFKRFRPLHLKWATLLTDALPELTGAVLMKGFNRALWIMQWLIPWRWRSLILKEKKASLITSTLFVTLFMTQARGPWLGALLALPVAYIGRAKDLAGRALLVCTLGLAFGIPAYIVAKQYVNAPTTSSEQQTAQYRKQLFDNYLPIARIGGAWGWGQDVPIMAGQDSIDNEYLRVYLAQGYVGLTTFLLLMLDTVVSLVRFSTKTTEIRERHFIFSLLAIMAGFMFILATVYLGQQPYPIFFLLVGWSQSIRFSAARKVTVQEIETESPTMRVYT